MSSLRDWLRANGLGQYLDQFHASGIDLDVIASLNDADLRELGLNLGDRKRFLAAVATSKNNQATTTSGSGAGADQAERRQLTVVFCDLVGSTELSQKLDPEELRRLIRQYQDACAGAVARYDGHVAQFLGDGVLVYFGYPKAHEGEAERAIRAGLDIIDNVGALSMDHKLKVRIGIDAGLVVIGQGEALNEQERTAIGDAPNVAARLQSLAKPGSIVISDRARQLAGGAFEYADLGSHELKGISEPLHVWQVTGEKAVETRFDAATGGKTAPMVGRAMEMSVALQAWERAREGKLQVLLLCGEPGIGKSRILRAIRERLIEDGAQAWQYQCSPFFANTALYPVIANIERASDFERTDQPELRLVKLERLLKDRFGCPDLDVNLIGRLLGLPVDARYGSLSMSPQKQKDETIRALVDVGEGASERLPLIALYEDVHWSDPTTIEMLDYLLKRKAMRALVVITYRPEFKPPWSGQTQVTQLTLNRLDPDQTEQVATRVAGNKRLPKEIVEQIIQKTDGIPLYVEELTKAILETDIVKLHRSAYTLTRPLKTLAIPTTLNDSLMARLDRLAPTKEAAQIGACIGREFSHELLALVSTQTRDQLDHAIEQLLASELVYQRDVGVAAIYIFKHALVQDAAYESLLKSRRADIHARIARALEEHLPQTKQTEPELLAHHYTEAGLIEEAVPSWHQAGLKALSKMALTEAIAHFGRGLELTRRLTDDVKRENREAEVRAALGIAWIANGGWFHPKVKETMLPAWALAEKHDRQDLFAPILWGLGSYHIASGRLGEGQIWIEKSLRAADKTANDTILLSALMMAAIHQYWHGKLTESRRYAERIFERYQRDRHAHLATLMNFDPATVSYAYTGSNLWILGYPVQALRAMDEKNRNAEEVGHAVDQCFAWTFGEIASIFMGLNERYIYFCDRAEQTARDQRLSFFYECFIPFLRSLTWNYLHGPEKAYEYALATAKVWRTLNGGLFVPCVLVSAAESALALGRYKDALQQVTRALEEHVERPGWEERCFGAEVLRVKGLAVQGAGNAKGAEKCFQDSIEYARNQNAKSWELRTAMSYARLMRSQSRNHEARELLEPVYDWFTEGFDTRDLKEAKALLEELRVTA